MPPAFTKGSESEAAPKVHGGRVSLVYKGVGIQAAAAGEPRRQAVPEHQQSGRQGSTHAAGPAPQKMPKSMSAGGDERGWAEGQGGASEPAFRRLWAVPLPPPPPPRAAALLPNTQCTPAPGPHPHAPPPQSGVIASAMSSPPSRPAPAPSAAPVPIPMPGRCGRPPMKPGGGRLPCPPYAAGEGWGQGRPMSNNTGHWRQQRQHRGSPTPSRAGRQTTSSGSGDAQYWWAGAGGG